jgi:hypothetical protein
VKRADVRRAITKKADRHLRGLAHLRGPGGADRDRQMRADDRVGTEHAAGGIGQVHRSAFAVQLSVRAAEHLR